MNAHGVQQLAVAAAEEEEAGWDALGEMEVLYAVPLQMLPPPPPVERKYRGVRTLRSGKFGSEIWNQAEKRPLWLGTFPSALAAAYAYDVAARQLQGPRAKPNFDDPTPPIDVLPALAAARVRTTTARARVLGQQPPVEAAPPVPAEMSLAIIPLDEQEGNPLALPQREREEIPEREEVMWLLTLSEQPLPLAILPREHVMPLSVAPPVQPCYFNYVPGPVNPPPVAVVPETSFRFAPSFPSRFSVHGRSAFRPVSVAGCVPLPHMYTTTMEMAPRVGDPEEWVADNHITMSLEQPGSSGWQQIGSSHNHYHRRSPLDHFVHLGATQFVTNNDNYMDAPSPCASGTAWLLPKEFGKQ